MAWRKRLKLEAEQTSGAATQGVGNSSGARPPRKRRPVVYLAWGLFLLLVVPFDVTINAQGVLKPARSTEVIAPVPAQVLMLPPAIGTELAPGDVLMEMAAPDTEHRIELLQTRVQILSRHAASAGFADDAKAEQAILREQLTSAQKELAGLTAQSKRLVPTAPFAGQIMDVVPDIHVGDWVPKGQQLATFADPTSWMVDTYVQESDLQRLAVGNWARFVPDAPGLPAVNLKVVEVDQDASRTLLDPELGAQAGGDILVRQSGQSLIPERSVFRVRLQVQGDPGQVSTGHIRGSVAILGWPRSILGEFLRGTFTTLVREFGF
ncbi:MAG TPA: HlyD family efflux transporter periplasmic adaptor subunit [Orrella sp.]